MSEVVSGEGAEVGQPWRGLYPIRTLSRLTGVPAVTLRAWERRHRLLSPSRTDKGHRLYSEADVERVRQVLALLEQGVAVGQAGSLLAARPEAPDLSAGAGLAQPWDCYVTGMLEGVSRFDALTLDAIYNDALSLYPIELVANRLTTPVLERLGAAWPAGEASIAREHFFATFVRNKVGARFQHLQGLAQGPRLVAACPAGERHELGLVQFALAAAAQGYRLVLLGADVPEAEIAAAARIAGCRAVILSVSVATDGERLGRQLSGLVAMTPLPVMVGGGGALRWPQAIDEAGALNLGTDFGSALRHLADQLGL